MYLRVSQTKQLRPRVLSIIFTGRQQAAELGFMLKVCRSLMPTVMLFPPGHAAQLSPIQADSGTGSRAWLSISKFPTQCPTQRLLPRLSHPRKAHSECWEFSGAGEHTKTNTEIAMGGPLDLTKGALVCESTECLRGQQEGLAGKLVLPGSSNSRNHRQHIHDGLFNSQGANPQPLAPQAERAW